MSIVSPSDLVPAEFLEPSATNHFNPSIIDFEGETFMTYRCEMPGDKVVNYVDRIGHDLKPIQKPVRVRFKDGVRREDLRLFQYRSQLHVAYTLYSSSTPKQCYGKLDAKTGLVTQENLVSIKSGAEKNLQFFEHNSVLYSVYTIQPRHSILKILGSNAKSSFYTKTAKLWHIGVPHGGTPPIMVDGSYLSLFHAHIWKKNQAKAYFVGAYMFDPEPPFAIRHVSIYPLLVAGRKDPDDPRVQTHWQKYHEVVFPGGCIVRGRDLIVAFGHNDLEIGITKIPIDVITQSFGG